MSTVTPNKRGRKRAHSPDPVAAASSSSSSSSAAASSALPEVVISPPNNKKQKKPSASERNAQAAKEYNPYASPIYDNCNDVRRKIRAHLSKGVTATAFLRELGGKIAYNSYQNFMAMRHPNQGSGNRVFPAAYHYFERRRIAEGKPKSKSRLEGERIYPPEKHIPDPPVRQTLHQLALTCRQVPVPTPTRDVSKELFEAYNQAFARAEARSSAVPSAAAK